MEVERETISGIFEQFKLNRLSMLYYFFFIMRRQIMVFTLVFMPKFGNLQLSLHIFCSFTSLVYTALVKPYVNDNQNWQEIGNEVFILLGGYHMIMFTDFVPDEF